MDHLKLEVNVSFAWVWPWVCNHGKQSEVSLNFLLIYNYLSVLGLGETLKLKLIKFITTHTVILIFGTSAGRADGLAERQIPVKIDESNENVNLAWLVRVRRE